MKLIKDENLMRLFDLYKNMLSSAQQDFMTDFINHDLTISEIAENKGISRQAVNDAIKKAVSKLNDMEKTLGCLKKIVSLEIEIADLKRKVK